MLLTQLDMPSARYVFAYLATGEICQKASEAYRQLASLDTDAVLVKKKMTLRKKFSVLFMSVSNVFY